MHERALNYLGISYGTFLGATYANLFPGRVRSLVLDGDVNTAAWVSANQKDQGQVLATWLRQRADLASANTLNAFLGLCGRADTAHCAFSAGSAAATKSKFETLLQRFRSDRASYAQLVSQTVLQLYTSLPLFPGDTAHGWAVLATWLQEAWTTGSLRHLRVARPLFDRGAPTATPPRGLDAKGSYSGTEQSLAIFCGESPNPPTAAFWSLESLATERSGAVGPYWTWGSEPCTTWPARAADPYRGPWDRPTAHPVLVIGNTHDPATSYRGAIAMSRQLARARLLTVGAYGHTVFENPSACADRYEVSYYVKGTLPPRGARCEQDQPPFAAAFDRRGENAAAGLRRDVATKRTT